MLYLKNKNIVLKHILIIPILTLLSIPIIFLDMCVELYHHISFPLYGFACVKRNHYIKIIDREKLAYLTFWQKLYCMYCGYGNGVIHYWAQIADETERYWCGVKHQKDKNFIEPKHQASFSEYGNEKDFIEKYK